MVSFFFGERTRPLIGRVGRVQGKQRRQRLKGRVDPLGLDDDNVDSATAMAFDAPRDEAPVPSSLAELSAQVLPPAPPPTAPKASWLEPRGSFIRTRVSKKDKQAGKREQFMQTIAAAAAARQPRSNADADTAAGDEPPQPPVAVPPAESFVDDLLSAMADIASVPSADALKPKKPPTQPTVVRTSQQRARMERFEQQQFHAVLQHAAFKHDPVEALHEHLANRLRLEQAEREARERSAAQASTLAAHEVRASRRLERAMAKNRTKKGSTK